MSGWKVRSARTERSEFTSTGLCQGRWDSERVRDRFETLVGFHWTFIYLLDDSFWVLSARPQLDLSCTELYALNMDSWMYLFRFDHEPCSGYR